MRFEEYIKKNNIDRILESNDWRFEISNLITEARYFAGLTQADIAKKMNTKQSSISRVENGKILPSLEFLDKLAQAIGTELIAPRFAFMDTSSTNKYVVGDIKSPFYLHEATLSDSVSGSGTQVLTKIIKNYHV